MEALKAKSHAVWLWALVPAFGLFELGLHVWQVQGALAAEDWDAAVADLRLQLQDDDGVVVEPSWAEPSARRALGALATDTRFGLSDVTHYKRVWALSVQTFSSTLWGQAPPNDPLLSTWIAGRSVGKGASRIRVQSFLNPHHEPMVTDFLMLAERGGEENLTVLRGKLDSETPCVWKSGTPRVEADQEAWGLARGVHYVQCADNTKMSVQVIPDHNWRPRRCLAVPTTGPGARTRLIFHSVRFARIARIHDGLHGYEEDPQNKNASIKMSLSVQGLGEGGKTAEFKLGENTHHNSEAWKGFDIDTSAVPAGESGDLIVDVESDSGDRKFCLEGSTR